MTFEAADEELSKEKIAIVLQEVFARDKDVHVAYAKVQEGRRVFGKEVKELKKKDQVEMTDQKEKAYIFVGKESKQPVEDAKVTYVGRDVEKEEDDFVKGGEDARNSVKDEEKDFDVFAGKESKQPVEDAKVNYVGKDVEKEEDDFVKGWEDAKNSVKEEEEDFHVFACKESKKGTGQVRAADHVEIEQLIRKIITEAVEVKQLTNEKNFVEAKNVFRSLERSFAILEKVDRKIFVESEGVKEEDSLEALKKLVRGLDILLHAPHGDKDKLKKGQVRAARENVWRALKCCRVYCKMLEDCSTVGVQEDNNVYNQDGEDAKPEVVREASREEILEAEGTVEKIKKAAAVKETFERFETAEVVHGKCERIDETAKAKAVNVAKVAAGKKEFSNVIESVENCKDSEEQSNDPKCFANLFNFNIPAGSYAKLEYDKVKADDIEAKYDGEYVKATDAKKVGNPADDRENDNVGIDVNRAVRCKADDVKPVRPVCESSVQIVKEVGAGVLAAESNVSRPAVGAGLMYSREYRAGEHAHSKICEVDSGTGAGDLKQPGRLDAVGRNSLLEQLLTDVSQVEEPDGLTLAMDPVYTEKYKSADHMYSEKYGRDGNQGAEVFVLPGRLDIVEQDIPLQQSFTGASCAEVPSKLKQQDMQRARAIYSRNQAGWCKWGQEVLRQVFHSGGVSSRIDCFMC